ncbi:STAS domain-containing protein [Conexibacter sp. W3-3-2]|uniref:STAS domain-containing protein n=1 Tax=Conexibacter sp. W3-3-2 TaxID=2675227 RepID=UPI0012B6EF18|nr:STAS domain-containing protein [Conexibacter sp. W3-3-2]
MEAQKLSIEQKDDSRRTRVTVRGTLDLAGVGALDDHLDGVTAPEVVLDLLGVPFMDSSGLALLLDRTAEFRGQDRTLTLAPSAAVRAVLDLAQVDGELDLVDG